MLYLLFVCSNSLLILGYTEVLKKSHRERTQPAANQEIFTTSGTTVMVRGYTIRFIYMGRLRGPLPYPGSTRSFHGILWNFPIHFFRFVMQLVSCTSSRFRERNCRKNHPGLIFPWLFEQMLKDMLTLKGIFKNLPTKNTRLFMQAFSSQRVNR